MKRDLSNYASGELLAKLEGFLDRMGDEKPEPTIRELWESWARGMFEMKSDEECDAEAKELWPSVADEDMSVICDVCFEQFMEWRKQHA